MEIIALGDGIARIDTSDGSIWRFNGDPRKPNVRAQWVREHRGVDTRPTGALRLTQVRGATFLVDAGTGETWILRARGSNFEWDPVTLFR